MIYCLIPTTPDRNKRLFETLESIFRSNCDQKIQVIIDYNEYEGLVKSVLRMVNSVDGLCTIVPNDVIIGPSTLQELYNTYIKEFPNNDGMVGWSDGFMEIQHMCMPFCQAKLLREIVNPIYFHNFSDREWTEIMKRRGKYYPITKSMCIHNHYSRNPALKDKSYEINERTSSDDGKIFWQRFEEGFKDKV